MQSPAPPMFESDPDVENVLREPAVASLVAKGAPVFVAAGAPARVIYATPAARAFFDAADDAALSAKLFASGDQGAKRLLELSAILRIDAPPRLEKLRFALGRRVETLTCLCRRAGAERPLLVVGALGVQVAAAAPTPALIFPSVFSPPVSPVNPQPATPDALNVAAGESAEIPQAPPSEAPSAEAPPAPSVDGVETPMEAATEIDESRSPDETPAARPLPAPATAQAPPLRSLAEVEAEFATRFAGMPSVRFLWKTDAEARFREITGQLCEAVGCDSGALIGKSFPDHARFAGADPEGAMAAAFARRETWSGLGLTWPVAGSSAAVPISLGGVPSFDREKTFDGFRGFGVIRIHALEPRVAETTPQPAAIEEPTIEASEAAHSGVDSGLEPRTDAPVPDAGQTATDAPDQDTPPSAAAAQSDSCSADIACESGDSTAAASPSTEPPANPVDPQLSPTAADAEKPAPAVLQALDNVVRLRPLVAQPSPPPSPDPEPRVTESGSRMVELTPSERQAFGDIARALGAKPIHEDALSRKAAANQPANDPGEAPAETVVDDAETPTSGHPAAELSASDEDDPLDREDAAASPPEYIVRVAETGAPIAEPPTPPPPAASLAEAAAANEPEASYEAEIARNAATVLEKIPFGVMVSRLEAPIYLNRALLDMLGFKSADLFHEAGGLERMFHGRQAEDLASAANGGSIPVVAASGDVIPAETRLHAIEWDGAPATLMSFRKPSDMDLLPHVRSLEAELRQGETQNRELHAILDTATDGVVTLDQNGRILSLNRAGEALFGYEQNEVAGEPFATLLAPESQNVANEYLAGLQANGVASLLNDGREAFGRARRGGVIPLFMTLGRLGVDGRKYCAVLRDMTQWKKAERELRDARRDAERASQLKSDFLAKISHEIRTPLNAIIGFAEVIMEERFGPVGNERYKDYLKDIHASGGHVMSLVNDLLDLSKIEAGKADLSFVAVDANKVVSECVSMIQPQAAAERVIVRLSLAPRLPKIVVDERSLRQIVINILSNAVKFNRSGGQVIVSSALTDSGSAVLRVKDTGIGMTEAEVKIALEPFMQIQTSRSHGGTGLGLPLTKALVEANRANFSIRSKKEEGTLVEVSFPSPRVLAE